MSCPNRRAGDQSILQFRHSHVLPDRHMLLFPGSVPEPLWRLNPSAQQGFTVLGVWAILLMIVGAACAVAALGLWGCTRLGYRTAVVVLSVNIIGDLTNSLVTSNGRSLIGLPIGGAMIW
jgi:hypothetical protein